MTWIDKIDNKLILKTGDGKEYTLDFIASGYDKSFNTSSFEFPGIQGTLVKRSKSKGRASDLSIFFQGEDHIDQAEKFEKSSEDSRHWIMTHPYYGQLNIQPTSIKRDDTKLNITFYSISWIETIVDESPKTTIDSKDQIIVQKEITDQAFIDSYDEKGDSKVGANLQKVNETNYLKGVKAITDPIDGQNYFNAFKKASGFINTIILTPLSAMREIQNFVNAPALFKSGIEDRIGTLTNQYTTLQQSLGGITNRAGKKTFELYGGANIAAQALAVSSPLSTDFKNRTSVSKIISKIVLSYDTYLSDLDSLQTLNGGSGDSAYIPDFNALNNLDLLINFALSSLYNASLNANQERIIIIDSDTDLISLSFKLYGSDPFDENLNKLIENNELGLNDFLIIKKGRSISYFV